jgi:protein TonB
MVDAVSRFRGVGILASVLVHASAFWALGEVPSRKLHSLAPSMVDFSVAESEPPPPPPPEPEPEPEEPEEAPEAAAPAAPEAPPEAEPEPEPEPVADLTGLTLTNDGPGAGWSSAVGDGSTMGRPLKAGRVRPEPEAKPIEQPKPKVAKEPRPLAPKVVPAKDLSEKPVPPNLNGVLQNHYPATAREMGLEGKAVVRLRIDADGKVRQADVVSESGAGFGSACRATVLGSTWSAPRDQGGQSVATFVSYTCRFQVGR